MKLVGVKVGQILKDKFGNKFEVTQIDDGDDFMPVELKCVKFVKDVCFGRDTITKPNFHSWILKDRSKILSSDSIVGEFLKEHFYPSEYNSFDDLELIDIVLNGVECRFLFGDAKAIKKVDVTLKDLCIDDNTNYPTKDNVRLDDIIVDKNGTEYRVIARNSTGIDVKYVREFVGIDGVVFNVNSTMYVPFSNSSYPDGMFTTKEFVFKNK